LKRNTDNDFKTFKTSPFSDKFPAPFFTTKEVGNGSGLGLSISHNIIVKKHGGDIFCNSRPGKTTITVRLPLTIKTVSKEISA
jgi:nitrogen-specific signal transduction histidine kinase